MAITEAKYGDIDHSSINALVNGTQTGIPVNLDNRYYAEIVNEGIPVEDFVADLGDSQQIAKRYLADYYTRYSRSEFTAGGNIFRADPNAQVSYLTISEILRLDPANSTQVVVDKEGDPHPVADAAAWSSFWTKYEELFDAARSVVSTAWTDVKSASTEAEVQAILDALPAIPGE